MIPQINSRDNTRFLSNVLVLVLLIGNIFFAYQYIGAVRAQGVQQRQQNEKDATRIQIAQFNKFFIDTVVNNKSKISSDDRIKLENDIRQIHDEELLKLWNDFVNGKDSKATQESAAKLMAALAGKII